MNCKCKIRVLFAMKFQHDVLLLYMEIFLLPYSASVSVELLKISNGSSIGLFNLWYLTNISCGANTDSYFRSDLIDRLDPLGLCPDFYYISFSNGDNMVIGMKFLASDPMSLENDLLPSSVYETPTTLPKPHIVFIRTTDGFEFKQTDDTGNILYTGVMTPSNTSNIQFIVNVLGHDLTGGLPTSSSIDNVKVVGMYNDVACTDVTTENPPDATFCDTPPSVTEASSLYTVVYGDNMTLSCTVASPIPIKHAYWYSLITDRVDVNASYLPGEMSFEIEGVTFSDAGVYSCFAVNQLDIIGSGTLTLTVTGDVPLVVSTSPQSINTNVSDTVTFDCTVTASPITTDIYWKKIFNGVETVVSTSDPRFTLATPPSASLTITSLLTSDSGQYFCMATNVLGTTTGIGITLSINTATINTDLCPCSCDYLSKVEYWASHNVTNMTHDQILNWLAPKIKELEKKLTVDKTNISAIVNKRISVMDSRSSARNIGVFGVVVLVVVISLVVLMDVSSLSRHKATISRVARKMKVSRNNSQK